MSAMQTQSRYPAVATLACFLCLLTVFGQLAHAQGYLTSGGTPAFSAPEPVELGFSDTANGNLHLNIPLASYPQRGTGHPEGVSLEYDSHIWQTNTVGSTTQWQPDTSGGWQL